jgi:hypothetical protein
VDSERYKILKNLHSAQGDLAYMLAVFGDHLAEREKYKDNGGIDAVHFYLVQKFSWPVSQVRGMSYEDLRFVLSEEMSGWRLPKEAIF